MKHVLAVAVLAAVPAWLNAQQTEPSGKYNGSAFAYYAAGGVEGLALPVGAGAGAEGFVYRWISAGVQGTYLSTANCAGCGFGIVTGNVGVHFVDRSRPKRFDPFLTFGAGGVTNLESFEPALAYGGGVNWWFSRRFGVRTEVRGISLTRGSVPLGMVTIGLSFR